MLPYLGRWRDDAHFLRGLVQSSTSTRIVIVSFRGIQGHFATHKRHHSSSSDIEENATGLNTISANQFTKHWVWSINPQRHTIKRPRSLEVRLNGRRKERLGTHTKFPLAEIVSPKTPRPFKNLEDKAVDTHVWAISPELDTEIRH